MLNPRCGWLWRLPNGGAPQIVSRQSQPQHWTMF